jgi:hypothetical protein
MRVRGRPRSDLTAFGLALAIVLLTTARTSHEEAIPPIVQQREAALRTLAAALRPTTPTMALPDMPAEEASAFQLASLGPAPEVTGTLQPDLRTGQALREPLAIVFPVVNRAAKGDRLPPGDAPGQPSPPVGPEAPPLPFEPDPATAFEQAGEASAEPDVEAEIDAAARYEPFPEYDIAMSLELHPRLPLDDLSAPVTLGGSQPDISLLAMANDPDPTERTARIYFGAGPLSFSLGSIEPWAAGEEPILMLPRSNDPDLKRAALSPLPDPERGTQPAGESVAGKGEVTGEGRRPRSPAERLELDGKAREKAERCLANAVYFESRGEAVRGQLAVAQVVINRVFSGYYPTDVCGVVYQNAHRRLACQFTFACDGHADTVSEPDPYRRARIIAKAALDGRFWLTEVGKATHYHAYWVRPWWVRTMRRHTKIGVHTFYRPQKWGDGEDAPTWGTAAATTELATRL